MGMELWTWSSGEKQVLILNPRGKPPIPKERGLFLCRSLTLPADRLLMGPVGWTPCPGFCRVDHEGVRIPADVEDAGAFLSYLAAAGYGVFSAATDGIRQFTPEQETIKQWQGKRQPDDWLQRRLLSLY